MFWFFSLITHVLLLTQLPLVFLIVVATFIITSFLSLSLSCYALTQKFSVIPLFKASSLFIILAFIPLFLLSYFLYIPLTLLISILRYYLQLHTLKICFILLLSALSQIAFIFMIGALSAWANHHGWHLNLG